MASPATVVYGDPQLAALVVSAQRELRAEIVGTLTAARWRTLVVDSGAEALSRLEESGCQVLLLDDVLPDLESAEVAMLARGRFPGLSVVVLGGADRRPLVQEENSSAAARELVRLLSQSCAESEPDEGRGEVRILPPRVTPVPERRYAAPQADLLPDMVGHSVEMARVYRMTRLVAPRHTPVLITGATGTGKELIARAVHQLSSRAGKPMVTINCAAIPESLLESELFGFLRGAFTGAVQSRIGRIHAAHNGTLFLDEIGDMPLNLQSKLLRFLENGEVQRLGSADVFRVDVRVIAASNVDLDRRARSGQFREDLYYRLSVFPIALPPLSRRGGDLRPLAEHFLQQFGLSTSRISQAAMDKLMHHGWPGNVRELRHVMERASILAETSPVIAPEHIVLSSQWQATA